jgi:hypothetical protein
MIRPAFLAALLLALAALPAFGADAPIGVITIVEGELVVLRETREFTATEGLRLRADDIVRSRDSTRLARIELDGGAVLDIGPATELLLQPRAFAAPTERSTALYLLRGWLKVTTSADKAATGVALASPQLGVARVAGSVVVHALGSASLVFVETGKADVFERTEGRPAGAHTLRDGDAFAARTALPGELRRRPPPDLIDGLPRAFADSLPRRAAQWQSRVVEPGPATELAYAGVAAWINAEAVLRPSFVQRFNTLARDRRFRAGLVAELRAHPEWDRTLFPEKYRPKTVALAAPRRAAPPAVPASVPAATPAADPSPALAQAPKSEIP